MKICSTCKIEKENFLFQKRAASNDGLTASCKECLKKRDADRYPKEKVKRSASHKAYLKTEAGKISSRESSKKWQEQNLLKRAAHVIVGNAVRDKRLIPWPVCAVPECCDKPEAHHPDYDRPLDVVWLCPYHHKQAHALVK